MNRRRYGCAAGMMHGVEEREEGEGAVGAEFATLDLEGLRCPHCDYDVRASTEGRCPECGGEFDPDELRATALGVPQPTPCWDPNQNVIGNWIDTGVAVLFTPGRYARRFPPEHQPATSIAVMLVSYGLAVGIVAALILALRIPIKAMLIFGSVPVVAGWACEASVAALLTLLVWPTGVRRRYHFWRGLTRAASFFFVLTVTWLCAFSAIVLTVGLPSSRRGDTLGGVFAVGMAVILGWWSACLIRFVWTRSAAGRGRWAAAVLIPVIGVVTLTLAYGVAVMLVIAATAAC